MTTEPLDDDQLLCRAVILIVLGEMGGTFKGNIEDFTAHVNEKLNSLTPDQRQRIIDFEKSHPAEETHGPRT